MRRKQSNQADKLLYVNRHIDGKGMNKKCMNKIYMNHKGMEMWQVVLIILALLLLFFMFVWSGALGDKMSSLLSGFGERF